MMFKVILTLLIGSMSYALTPATQGMRESAIRWISIEEAQQLVKEEPRGVFIDIYADWCGWCKVMERKTFSQEEVAQYVKENYYAVRLDFESRDTVTYKGKRMTERELCKSFQVSGLPTIIFIDSKFKKVRPVSGYQNAEQFLRNLRKYDR